MYPNSPNSNSDGGAQSKTPVSLLQELCMRRGIAPKYDLLQIEGPVHEPTFVYRVTVGEFAANGSGTTKKKAKHAAAKSVLDVIIQGGSGNQGQLGAIPDLGNQTICPYDDGIAGNPIGLLQELCMNRRLAPPTYDVTNEDGFPHEKNFSVCCQIGSIKEIGIGKSKKLAKRQAANKMYESLKSHPADQPPPGALLDEDDEIAQKLAARYSSLKSSKMTPLSSSESRKVSQFHKNLKQEVGPKLLEIQRKINRKKKNNSLNALMMEFVPMLQDIAQEGNFAVTYVEIEEKSISGHFQCLVQLSTAPLAVCYGSGASMKEAQAQAALNALEYLKAMTSR